MIGFRQSVYGALLGFEKAVSATARSRWDPLGSVEEMGYVGTAIGLLMIAVGLGVAWLSDACRCLSVHKNAAVRRFEQPVYAMLGVSLIATLHEMVRGNEWSLAARQLPGSLSLAGGILIHRRAGLCRQDSEWPQPAAV